MFADIEKEYKKCIKTESNFDLYYWIIAIIILIIDGVFYYIVRSSVLLSWMITGLSILTLLIAIFLYFLFMFLHLKKTNKEIKGIHSFKVFLQIEIRRERMKQLASILREYGITTKDDIQCLIDYLYHLMPVKVSVGNTATWISVCVAIASLFLNASNETGTNFENVAISLANAINFLVIPFIITECFKSVFKTSTLFYNRRRSLLLDDLLYFKIHYIDYKHILLEEDNSPSLLQNNKKDTK